jgi:CubicO group peptidase (beta-lactamase class C family)
MRKLLLLFLFQSVVTIIIAQKIPVQKLSATIDSIAISAKNVANVPGFAVGVIVDNQIIFEKTYGVQSLKSNVPLNNYSDFHMASVSKPFTATAILQLVQSGKLNLNGKLSDYLSDFKMKDERYKLITLYNILTHSSGIPDVADYEWGKPQTDDSAADRYARSFAEMNLDFAPDSQFNYSNAAFDILADVIAKASGTTFEEYIRQHIFLPVGMNNSSFLLSDIPLNRRTSPHIIDNNLVESISNVYPYNRIHAPSSTLHSNINDMLKWVSLWLNKGVIDGHTIIDIATWSNMLTTRRQATPDYKVCLSWFTVAVGDKTIFFHTGGDLGYRSFVGFDPRDKVAVVLMGNNNLLNTIDPALAIFKSILLNAPAKDSLQPIFWKLRKYILKDGITKVKEVYYAEQKKKPTKYSLGASNVWTLADWLYDRGYKQKSIDVLIFCTELDPDNFLWCEYIADVYAAWGKKAQALEWYKKALVLSPSNKEIEQKINSLK